jgi:chaperonin GroES
LGARKQLTKPARECGGSLPRRILLPRETEKIPERFAEVETLMSTATKTSKKKSADGVKLQPLGDRVVVEREESESKTAGGIVLPDSAKDKPSRGTVIAVGDGRLLDDGSRSKLQVKVGDKVLFTSYAPESIRVNDQELLLMREEDILAVID